MVGWYLPIAWREYFGLTLRDRQMLQRALMRLLDKMDNSPSITGAPPRNERRF